MGQDANRKAQNSADKATGNQKDLIKRQTMLFDMLFNNAKGLDESGAFDPDKQIKSLEDQTAKYESRDAGNSEGALATLGYKPGDSAVNDALVRTKLLYRNQLDQMRTAITRQSIFDKISAYSAANPQYLSQGIATYGQQAANAQSQVGNPANAFAAIMPFLQGMGGSGGGAGQIQGSTVNPFQLGGGTYGGNGGFGYGNQVGGNGGFGYGGLGNYRG